MKSGIDDDANLVEIFCVNHDVPERHEKANSANLFISIRLFILHVAVKCQDLLILK